MGRSGKTVICLDACVIGHVLVPEKSSAPIEDIEASKVITDRIIAGTLKGCSPSVMISETKWFIGRLFKESGPMYVEERADEVEDLLPPTLGPSFKFIDVNFAIAALATDFRFQYYAKSNPFSYNDGIYLATASITGCEALITTDTHLLATKEVLVLRPSAFLARYKV